MGKGLITLAAALGMAAIAAGGGWLVLLFLRPEAARGPGLAVAVIGPATLRYDPAYGRASDDINGGRLDRLDIAARFPSFAPAGPDPLAGGAPVVFLRIEEADPVLPPEDRTAKLYERFLEPEQWSNPGGLVMRRFEAGSPYEREELYYAPPEGRLFAARCTRPRQPPDGLPESCIGDLRVNGLDVHARFTPDLLADWERLSAGARALVERMSRQDYLAPTRP